jgi:hypothetical protein
MNDLKEKVYRTELRFRNKKQRNQIKVIAKKNGRSVNAELLLLIDNRIAECR